MKKFIGLVAVAAFSSIMASSAMAGTWKQNNVGWWFDNGNGTYPASTWQWIDGNNDGIAECYYFDRAGYMLANTNTPDGYQVNASGAWVQNGAVQTKNVGTSTQSDKNSGSKKANKSSQLLYNVEPSYSTAWGWGRATKEKVFRVTGGKTWTDVLTINPSGVMEFSNEAGYTVFKATVAPEIGSNEESTGEFIVYGDGGNVLYRSDEIVGNETEPFNVDVDITGQSKIQLAFSSTDGYFVIGIKSARFE
jgi:putative choline binding protein